MSRPVGTAPMLSPPIIGPASRLAWGARLARIVSSVPSSGQPWGSANVLLAIPFSLEAPETTFYKGFWVNGTVAGSNWEVGIWDAAFNKIVTTGSVAGSGNSVPQAAALSATTSLPPGAYYMGIAHNSTTANRLFCWQGTLTGALMVALGAWNQGSITLGSLASTATPVGNSNVASIPVFGLITRSVFDV